MPELERHRERPDHLLECRSCAALWERQRAVAAGLRSVAAGDRSLQAPPRVEANLIAAFRQSNGAGVRTMPGPVRPWTPALVWMAAAAALVLVSMWLANGHPPQSLRRAPAATELASAELASDSVYDNDFIPLPNAVRIAPNEEVNLVRVEVPRSAMIGLGYAVTADRAAETVEAEVVLGSDGLARAVRFLDE